MTEFDFAAIPEGLSSVSRPQEPRQGWEEQFQRMAENNDDRLIDGEPLRLTAWEEAEWEWPLATG